MNQKTVYPFTKPIKVEGAHRYNYRSSISLLRTLSDMVSLNFCTPYKEIEEDVLMRTGGACIYCLKTLFKKKNNTFINVEAYHIDHIYPVNSGGLITIGNVAFACNACNLAKSDSDPVDYMRTVIDSFNPEKEKTLPYSSIEVFETFLASYTRPFQEGWPELFDCCRRNEKDKNILIPMLFEKAKELDFNEKRSNEIELKCGVDQEFWERLASIEFLETNGYFNSRAKTLITWVKHAGNRSTEKLNGKSIRELSSTELKTLFNEVQETEEVGSDNRSRINQALLLAAKESGIDDWDPVRSSKIKNGNNEYLLKPMQVKSGWPTEKEKGELVCASIKVGSLITGFVGAKRLEEMAKYEVSELFYKVRDQFPAGSRERSHVIKVLNRLAEVLGVHWVTKLNLSTKAQYLNSEYFIRLNDPTTYSVKEKIKDTSAKRYAGASINILKEVLDEIGIEEDLKQIDKEVIVKSFNDYIGSFELKYDDPKKEAQARNKAKHVLSVLAEMLGFSWVYEDRRKGKIKKKVKAIKTSSSSKRRTPNSKVKKEEEPPKEIVMCKENKELFERMNTEAYWEDGLRCSVSTPKTRRRRVTEIWEPLSTYIDLAYPIQAVMETEMTSALSLLANEYDSKSDSIKSNGKTVLAQLAIEAKVSWLSENKSFVQGYEVEPIEVTLYELEKKRGRTPTEDERRLVKDWYRYQTRAVQEGIFTKSNGEPYERADQGKRQKMTRKIKGALEVLGVDLYAADVKLPKIGETIPLIKESEDYTSGEAYTHASEETYVQLSREIYGKEAEVLNTGLSFD